MTREERQIQTQVGILQTVDVLERKPQFLERRNQERSNTVDSHRDKYQA